MITFQPTGNTVVIDSTVGGGSAIVNTLSSSWQFTNMDSANSVYVTVNTDAGTVVLPYSSVILTNYTLVTGDQLVRVSVDGGANARVAVVPGNAK